MIHLSPANHSKRKRVNGEMLDWLILMCIVFPLSFGAYQRNAVWNSEPELWKDCVKKSSRKERTHHNLGFAYFHSGQYDKALETIEKAI